VGVYGGVEPTWASQTNTGRTHIATKGVVQSGLVLNLDAGVSSSYPGSGTTWTDLSGNGNNGTLLNGVGYVGTNGGALSFDGVDDNITTGKVLVPRTGQFHIEGWCYLNQTNINCMFVTQYNNDSDAGRFLCFFGNDGTIRMHDGGGVMTGTTPSYSANQWYYVAFQRDSSNLCNIFVNGVKQTTGATKTTTLENTNTIIGIRGSNTSGIFYNGRMSNVRIYNRALTAAEIQQNFNAARSRFGI
jgi:hypothetical protein